MKIDQVPLGSIVRTGWSGSATAEGVLDDEPAPPVHALRNVEKLTPDGKKVMWPLPS